MERFFIVFYIGKNDDSQTQGVLNMRCIGFINYDETISYLKETNGYDEVVITSFTEVNESDYKEFNK